jgi:hypothetical protein
MAEEEGEIPTPCASSFIRDAGFGFTPEEDPENPPKIDVQVSVVNGVRPRGVS